MSGTASGPTLAGGMQPIVKDGYELLYLPEVHNDALQREGKAPVFYYLPNYIHLARKDGQPNGDYMLNLIRFAGVQSADTTVGAQGDREVAGGVLTFTVNSAPPDSVLQESQQQIIDQWRAQNDYFWGIRTDVKPVFRPVPIVSNITSISNVSPSPRGVPALEPVRSSNGSRGTRSVRLYTVPPLAQLPRTVPASRDTSTDSNLDAWYWNMQGQGNGSIDPMGTNAYSALLGAYPTAILWQAFHGTASPIVVIQALKIKMWAPLVEIRIHGSWKRVFDGFQAEASGHYLWFSADIKAQFNKMVISGDIEVEVSVDPTIPGAEKIDENITKRSDLVFEKFMAAAQSVIFGPPQPTVEPASASSTGSSLSPWGVGLALSYRHDETDLTLDYHEKREQAYLQDQTISSSLSGLAQEISQDPQAEKKYFLSVFLDDWPRKIGRIAKPVVNFTDQPVAFASVQIGYPNTNGELQWTGTSFGKTTAPDASWKIGITQKPLSEVSNPPANWAPDQTFVKRTIHMDEPLSATANPFIRAEIDDNSIDLDPQPNGSLMNDITIEVRADSASRMALGPIGLGVQLQDATQQVEVTFDLTDDRGQSLGRNPVRFQWSYADQDQPRFWSIYSSNKDLRAFFRYQVRVVVKGSLFSAGMEWTGAWETSSGNGPFTVRVPLQSEPGVVSRELPSFLTAAAQPAAQPVTQPASHPAAQPPAQPVPAAGPPSAKKGMPQRAGQPAGLEVSGWSVAEPVAGKAASRDMPATSSAPPAKRMRPAESTPRSGHGQPASPPAMPRSEPGYGYTREMAPAASHGESQPATESDTLETSDWYTE